MGKQAKDYDLRQLRQLLDSPSSYPGGFAGRGVVFSAGGNLLPGVYVAVRSLRQFGCQLPVEIWYLGNRERPSNRVQELFEQQNVSFVDSIQQAKEHRTYVVGGWPNKPFSILRSRFKEVISLDADNMVLQNPERLFTDYRSTGALMWPDFFMKPGGPWTIRQGAWELLGLAPKVGAEIESGQLCFDKERVWKALNVVMHMNENYPFYYTRCSYGDKDTFTLAFALTNTPCTVVAHRPKHIAQGIRIHFANDGSEMFQHCRKWRLPTRANPSIATYRLEKECFTWLDEFKW